MDQEELVELGRTVGAYGFKGWVRVAPIDSGEVLEQARQWVLINTLGEKTAVRVRQVKYHGMGLIAKWDGCESKEDADAIRAKIFVARSDFPDAGDDAVWAVDLVGCQVINRQGDVLGEVTQIGDNGVQEILVIGYEADDGQRKTFMIPNVKDVYIDEMDVDNRVVRVDFDASWR